MLDKASYTPLYIQVREYILNRIRMGDYKVGDRLPTEKELMEQLQVGRATVRAALNELEHEGQVEKRHGIGTFVKEPKRELGFEPLISLSHYLDKMGIRCVNRVVKDEPVTVEAGVLSERWAPGRVVRRLKRVRYGEKIPVAVEDNYFTQELYERIAGSAQSEASIAHVILTQEDLSVGKIDYSIVRRVPTEKEQAEGVKGAHPNSRFTAPAVNCPCISPEFENPQGVPISAFVFGGRRAKLAPLVYQSRDWNHGVFVGSIMASETTAAAAGAVGVVRRDPMAMLPFCGYNMADYWQHWIDIGATLDADKAPKIFNVNWFRKDDEGNFMWPGFGDNLRVLEWIIKRCEGKVDAVETPIGYVPDPKDINLEGLEGEVTIDSLKSMLDVDKALWNDEAEGIAEFYAKFGDKVPAELQKELANLKENLQ